MQGIIVNADDFGLSKSVNRAILESFEKNLISDTTMLAGFDSFDEAIDIAYKNSFEDRIGVHFNLNTGEPITDKIKQVSMFCKDGCFHGQFSRLKPLNSYEKHAVYEELTAQIKKIKDAGLNIDHADSHHHIHTAVFIAPIILHICDEFNIKKIRLHRNIGNIPAYKKAVKHLYNSALTKKGFKTVRYFGSLDDIGDSLPESLEIMVHPDYDKDGILIDRRIFNGDVPAGVPLYSIIDKYGIKLTSYGEL